jgi:hypothetical protein
MTLGFCREQVKGFYLATVEDKWGKKLTQNMAQNFGPVGGVPNGA